MAKAVKKSLLDINPRELKTLVRDIPTLPIIYQELFQKMQNPNVSVPEIAEIITQDQALSAKVLHLVNSAFYGYSKQIKTISRAVVILGFRAVRSAALAISVFDYFKDEESSNQIDIKQFWTHSIAVAAICKVLAIELRTGQQEEAFIVGLLHDVGKLIEKRYFAADFDDVCRAAQEQHLSWYDCEKVLFNIDHAIIGKAVFRNWDFPASVVEAVYFHHKPASSSRVPQLTSLVHVGDYLSYELGFGAPGAYPPPECSPDALKVLGVSLAVINEYKDKIDEELEHAMGVLKLLE